MSNKNYSVFSKPIPKLIEQKEEVKEIIDEPVIKTESIEACVTGCEKLFVRSQTNKESNPITTLNKDERVHILDMNASKDFYRIKTDNGVEGYCMKEYIAIIAKV